MSEPFIHDDFLLQSQAARELYHHFAKGEPILDFHNHLPPDQIAQDTSYRDMAHIWLAEDHYKWRAMRANGIDENLITGDGDPRAKFDAFAATVPHTLRNALYHWTHLELTRYFGYEVLLSPDTAEEVWTMGNAALATPDFTCRALLERMKVRGLCTTDDPLHSLEHHKAIAEDDSIDVGVYPTFRPDVTMRVNDAAQFNDYVDRLADLSGIDCGSFSSYLDAIRSRHDYFHEMGGRVSDHDLYQFPDLQVSEAQAAKIFDKVRTGEDADAADTAAFSLYLMLYYGELDAERGWTKQLHMGCERNNNTRLFNTIGRDLGCDSPGDVNHGKGLRNYLDTLDSRGHLPKTIVYNLNPKDNYLLSTMIGNFQGSRTPDDPPCRMQYGTAWWFLDTKEGMEWQINTFSNTSLLSRFLGMLTDSRSFLSFTRHEYFRRILCNVIGADVEKGEIPRDMEMVGDLVKRICYQNAVDYFQLGSE